MGIFCESTEIPKVASLKRMKQMESEMKIKSLKDQLKQKTQ